MSLAADRTCNFEIGVTVPTPIFSPLIAIDPPVTLLSEAESRASLALVTEPSAGVTLLNPDASPAKRTALSFPVTFKSPPMSAIPLTVSAPWIVSGPVNFTSPATSNLASGFSVPMPTLP